MPGRSSHPLPEVAQPLFAVRSRSVLAESTAAQWAAWFGEETGLSWNCVDVYTGEVVTPPAERHLSYHSPGFRARLPHGQAPVFYSEDDLLVEIAIPLPGAFGNGIALTSHCLTTPGAQPLELKLAAADQEWSNSELESYLHRLPTMSLSVAQRFTTMVLDKLQLESREAALEHEVGALSQQLAYSTDEVSLLHGLTERLNLMHTVRDLAGLSLQRVHGLIDAEGHILFITDAHGDEHCFIEGEVPFNAAGLDRLKACLTEHVGQRTFVRNELAASLGGESFPGLESLVAAAIGDGPRRRGWIISCNLRYGHFGLVEANLLNTVARLLNTHSQNQQLFHEQDELLVDFVRTLVSTLDAKDPYTRGHSERVALIARRLSQHLGLSEDEQNDIYLSSLLHDIGKVGIDDRILSKPDQLTAEEFAHIQRHPDIGYQILKPLRHMQAILPGVRSHHEAYNGRGYPQGLAGDEIPLMARIIAVADSYDAMSSDRPYRRGISVERVEDIFRRGSGEQWDRRVIEAYFALRDEIRVMCAHYSLTDGNLLDDARSSIWGSLGKRACLLKTQRDPVDSRCGDSTVDASSVSTVILSHRPQTR